ncbi:phospho-N-acetylmuramoyl-pentapeptide-transferase [Rubrivirga sp. S365]|uniref:Phospho-N-acetylmuramoyl-pentapeptide-transferase n=1 Tax=Rubrivirga litoralis TaxID=3075598 RepID=A0ABU3BLP1_9BACT|nr:MULTISPECIES: phospho-N-acetylmuramoyl-pentapeptide-transferase [unclassified Rubrivirga]MDT0630209.1 phospho-N-acetylmuramoyl-pentapeptide-transferase [Rubrivirga sp. F394]MDT7855720.1 phospho-N-acetylmuramoyl-pentapeptide-transferase [Rubrivirga sp. S365]
MLYLLAEWIEQTYAPPGFQVFQFSTVRAGLAAGTALLVALFAGKRIIIALRRRQLGETVREGEDAGAVSHAHKAGTPTMGGVVLLLALASGVLLWADLRNPFVWVALVATFWMGAFGFADDYIKVVRKRKEGIAPRVKIAGQLSLGVVVAVCVLFFLPRVDGTTTFTSLPLVTDGGIDYDFLSPLLGVEVGWLVYIVVVTFILTGVSNAVNLTDGLDGLTAGTAAFSMLAIVAMTYVTGNANLAEFVNDVFLPGTSELVIFGAALAAACFGFLWYNGYPAQVFMGDTGSLALGAAIGTLAILIKKELYLPVVGAVFFAETVSVIVQTGYFKYTKRKYGEGRRVFRMAPLHHHYEAMGVHESKIVIRFWIVTALLSILTLFLFRIR